MENIQKKIEEMALIAEACIPLTVPLAPEHLENYTIDIKTKKFFIDGYELLCYYSISEFKNYKLKNLQIYSDSSSVLPFSLTFKLASVFLGKKELAYLEVKKDKSKNYVWTSVVDEDGIPKKCSADKTGKIYFRDNEITYVDASVIPPID